MKGCTCDKNFICMLLPGLITCLNSLGLAQNDLLFQELNSSSKEDDLPQLRLFEKQFALHLEGSYERRGEKIHTM